MLFVCTVSTSHLPLHKSATLNNRSLSPILAPHRFDIALAFAFFGNPHGVRATWQQKAKAVKVEERVMGTDHSLIPRSFRSMFCGLPHTPLNIMKFVSIYYFVLACTSFMLSLLSSSCRSAFSFLFPETLSALNGNEPPLAAGMKMLEWIVEEGTGKRHS